ncbi:MAG: hypothetical protein AAB448_03580 [Patescibacteria group bacterium]
MKAFIVCGYGIPEDIHKDQNYLTYLHVVFNRIYAEAKNEPALIIPCGGPTSCTPPYIGTEAEKIGEYLQELMGRDVLNGATKIWRIILEDTSLSSLENFLFAKRIIEENKGDRVTAFCEATRVSRNQETIDHLFGKGKVRAEGIDFDISKNRYLPNDIVEKKEHAEREHARWALESEENLAKHHAFFEEKFQKLRTWQAEGMSHVDAVTKWFTESIQQFEEKEKEKNGII